MLPPGPAGSRLKTLLEFNRDQAAFMERCRAEFGDTFTVRFPFVPPMVFVARAETIQQVFRGSHDIYYGGRINENTQPVVGPRSIFVLDGERHHHIRRLLTPLFTGDRMRAYGDLMCRLTDDAVRTWPRGVPFPVDPEMHAISMSVILRSIFGLDEGAVGEQLRELAVDLVERERRFPLLQAKFGLMSGTLKRMDKIIHAEIARRRAGAGLGREDVLQKMIEARPEGAEPFTDQEIRDNLVTLLLAGHETTATTLSWVFYYLSRHADVAERAIAEARSVAVDGRIQPDDVAKLEYVDAVIREVMRIQPILSIVTRFLQEPVTIEGYELPAETVVAPCMYLAHMSESNFPDPKRFDPDRFYQKRVSPYMFLPWGGGQRACLGMAFSIYEMRIVVGQTLTRVRPRPAPGYEARIIRRSTVLAPSDGMPMVAEPLAA